MPAARGEHPSDSGSGLNLACCLWTDAAPLSGDPSSVSCHTKTTGTCSPSLSLYQCVNTLAGPCIRTGARRPTDRVRPLQGSKVQPCSFPRKKENHGAPVQPTGIRVRLRFDSLLGAPDGRAQRTQQRERAADDTRRHESATRRPPGVQMGCEGSSRWGSLLEHSKPPKPRSSAALR